MRLLIFFQLGRAVNSPLPSSWSSRSQFFLPGEKFKFSPGVSNLIFFPSSCANENNRFVSFQFLLGFSRAERTWCFLDKINFCQEEAAGHFNPGGMGNKGELQTGLVILLGSDFGSHSLWGSTQQPYSLCSRVNGKLGTIGILFLEIKYQLFENSSSCPFLS